MNIQVQKYRHDLPQMGSKKFITDGGIAEETAMYLKALG